MSQYMLLVDEEEVDPAVQAERERQLPLFVDLHRSLREHRVAQGRTCALTNEHCRLVTGQAYYRLQEMAEILQVAVGKDALGAVALQLREQRTRIDSGDERALRRE